MSRLIEITESNYKDYCTLDIVAFSYAQPGAMGEPGGVLIVDAMGRVYHANYCYENLDYDHLLEVVPILKDCEFGILGHQTPVGWSPFYLGFGNHLTIKEDYSFEFEISVADKHFKNKGELYQQWLGMVMELLGKGDENLGMESLSVLPKN